MGGPFLAPAAPPRHSRAGGNLDYSRPLLDSRLRGNDDTVPTANREMRSAPATVVFGTSIIQAIARKIYGKNTAHPFLPSLPVFGTSIIQAIARKIYGKNTAHPFLPSLPTSAAGKPAHPPPVLVARFRMSAKEPKTEPTMALGPFGFRPAEVTVTGRPTLSAWEGPLQFALWCQRASPWWIGDLINRGEDLFGEEFGEVCGETLSTEMVSRYASVARRVPPQNRRPALSWSAHAVVARLPSAEQRRMLALAEDQGWNSEELRRQVRDLVNARKH